MRPVEADTLFEKSGEGDNVIAKPVHEPSVITGEAQESLDFVHIRGHLPSREGLDFSRILTSAFFVHDVAKEFNLLLAEVTLL